MIVQLANFAGYIAYVPSAHTSCCQAHTQATFLSKHTVGGQFLAKLAIFVYDPVAVSRVWSRPVQPTYACQGCCTVHK